MTLARHSHPHSGKRYSSKIICQTDQIITSTGYTPSGGGHFSLQLGYVDDGKAKRYFSVDLSEQQIVELRDRLDKSLNSITQYKAQDIYTKFAKPTA